MFTWALALVICLAAAGCAGQAASASPSTAGSAAESPAASSSVEPAVQATAEPAEAAPAGAVTITVNNEGARFHPDEVTVPADAAVFFLVHEGEQMVFVGQHNLHIGLDLPPTPALVSTPMLGAGDALVFTVTGLEPGTYRFWCTVHDHYTFGMRSEEHTSELQSQSNLVCRL